MKNIVLSIRVPNKAAKLLRYSKYRLLSPILQTKSIDIILKLFDYGIKLQNC